MGVAPRGKERERIMPVDRPRQTGRNVQALDRLLVAPGQGRLRGGPGAEQKAGQPERLGKRRSVLPSAGHAVIGQCEGNAPPPEVLEPDDQFLPHELLVITLVPANGDSEVGRVHVHEILGASVRGRFPPIAQTEFGSPSENGRGAHHRRPHPVRAHSEAASVHRLREMPAAVEADRVLDAAADEVQQIDRIPPLVVPAANLVEEVTAALPLTFPYFAVPVRRPHGLLHDGAQEDHHGRKTVGHDKALRATVMRRVDGHGGRAREGLVKRRYAPRQISVDDGGELALAALVRDRVRQPRHTLSSGNLTRRGPVCSIFVYPAPRCNPGLRTT